MIRLLIAGLMILMSGNANAELNNESLYKICKGYVDGGFVATDDKLLCLGYFGGVKDTGNLICGVLNRKGWRKPDVEIIANYFAIGSDVNISPNAVIQHYVNKMRDQPEKWSKGAQLEVLQSFHSILPCKSE